MAALGSKSLPWEDAPGAPSPQRKKPLKSMNCSTASLDPQSMQQASQSQASTFGRSTSMSQLKKGLAKLPPLPKQPLTFENLYVMAKKRANAKMTENRQVTLQQKVSPSSPASSRIHRPSRTLTAVALDVQGTPDPEELAWATEALASVPQLNPEEEEQRDEELARRGVSKESVAANSDRKESKRKSVRSSSKDRRASASQHLAAQMTQSEEQSAQEPLTRRPTRELAAETSSAYIQALMLMLDNDDSVLNVETTAASAVAEACASGAINERMNLSVNGFTDTEVKRMKTAFCKFKGAGEQEIHKDDLHQALSWLGYMKVTPDNCRELASQITTYALLDWEDYNDFLEKFREYEREEFQKDFAAMDQDGSGQLSVKEVKALISSMGVTPFRETLSEAMAVVDFDGSGALDFEEFVHLMAVYRVTEGFTRAEVLKLKLLFDRVSVHVPGGPKEVKADRLGEAMTHMFGPQAAGLAQKLARRFGGGISVGDDKTRGSFAANAEGEVPASDAYVMPGLPFQEFLHWCRRLREAEIEEYRKHFKAADVDNSGRIGPDEMRQVITGIGYMPLRTIVDEVLEKVDVDGDRQLDFDEFVNLMAVFRKSDGFDASQIAELTEIFNSYKQDDDYVDCLELMDMLRNMGYVTNLDTVRHFVKQVDFDNTNSLDLPEFIRLMRMHREVELNQALKVYDHGKQDERMPDTYVKRALNKMEYSPTDEMLEAAMLTLAEPADEDDAEPVEPPSEVDFDQFVQVLDICRKSCTEQRRILAGYSDVDVRKYKDAFEVYDEDSSGDIEKHELTNLLNDLGIPMRSKAEQAAMLEQLDVARVRAATAGVPKDLLGEMGDPSVTFEVLLFLVRMLHTAADQAEVDRDRKIMEATSFTPKEAEEFREIFVFWCMKAAALDAAKEAPDSEKKATTTIGKDNSDQQARDMFLTQDGVKRVVRSIGLSMSAQDRTDLDKKLDGGPHSPEHPGKFGFFEFLIFMRWMMDTNFCHMNEAMAMSAAEKSATE